LTALDKNGTGHLVTGQLSGFSSVHTIFRRYMFPIHNT
jgi:hypothetical protein